MVKITLISLLLPIKIASIIFTPSIETRKETGGICTSSPISFCYNFFEIKNQNVRPALKIISKGDILISEVLFNPRTGGVDFVEIYNNSGHDIDLKELQLANVNTAGEPANIKNVSSAKLMIAPGNYWVITTNQANIKLNYQVIPGVQISEVYPNFADEKVSFKALEVGMGTYFGIKDLKPFLGLDCSFPAPNWRTAILGPQFGFGYRRQFNLEVSHLVNIYSVVSKTPFFNIPRISLSYYLNLNTLFKRK